MMSTTRRISNAELKKIKEIQKILHQEGIKISQVELGEAFVEFSIQHLQEFLVQIKQRVQMEKEDRIELKRLLFESYEGESETDSVEEHDVII